MQKRHSQPSPLTPLSLVQVLGAASSLLLADDTTAAATAASAAPSYAQSSYYATLGLFVLTFPGLWSLVKRSVTYSPIRKTYVTAGPLQGKEASVLPVHRPTHVQPAPWTRERRASLTASRPFRCPQTPPRPKSSPPPVTFKHFLSPSRFLAPLQPLVL